MCWGRIPALPATPENIQSLRSGTRCHGGIKGVAGNGVGGWYFSPPNIFLWNSQNRRRGLCLLLRVEWGEDNSFDVGRVSAHVLPCIINVPRWRDLFGWKTAGGRSITAVGRRGRRNSSILSRRHAIYGAPLRGGGLPWFRGPYPHRCRHHLAASPPLSASPDHEATVGRGVENSLTLTLTTTNKDPAALTPLFPPSLNIDPGTHLAPTVKFSARVPSRLRSMLSPSDSNSCSRRLSRVDGRVCCDGNLPPQISAVILWLQLYLPAPVLIPSTVLSQKLHLMWWYLAASCSQRPYRVNGRVFWNSICPPRIGSGPSRPGQSRRGLKQF